jgi:hypothetical protein
MYDSYKTSILAKSSDDGPQEVDLTGYENLTRHQLTIEVPSPPSAGRLKIEMRQSGANVWMEIEGSPIDLTALNTYKSKILTIEALVGALQFTPTVALDTTYSVFIHSVR